MTISAVGSLNAGGAAVANNTAKTSADISQSVKFDFNTYLKIITTQLQHQDPTNATDPNQYTQELIQIEQVQVQNNTNTDLEGLTKATSANGLATGGNYIGNYVQAPSTNGTFPLQSGVGEFGYSLPSAAASTSITVQDSTGGTVATLAGGTAAGGNYVSWNGLKSDGTTVPDGSYTFVVNAIDGNGKSIASANPVSLFKVTSVQSNSDGTLQLLAGSLSLPTSDVTNLYTKTTLPSATAATVTG